MSTQQISANGTIRHQMGEKSGKFTIQYEKDGVKNQKRELNDVYINLPVTEEALEQAFRDYKATFGGHELTGIVAAAASKFTHAVESVRGDIRKALEAGTEVSDATIRKMFLDYTGPSGRKGGFTKPVVNEDEVTTAAKELAERDQITPEQALMRILVQRGVVKLG